MGHRVKWTEEHKMFRTTVRDFAEKELAPYAEEWDAEGIFPREVFKKAADLGLMGIRVDPEFEGSGLDWWFTTCYVEELVRCRNGGVGMALMVQSDMATPIIAEIGTQEQKELFLKPAVTGEKISALGISEPGVGSDVANLSTIARREGDEYVISGQKLWITNGTRADFITLAARTGDVGFGGVSLFTFPTDVKGFSVGKSIKKIGNKSSDTAELFFDECRIPARYILGEENMGFMYIMTNFQGERLVAALASVATMQMAIDDAIKYANERTAFGRSIAKFQVWRHRFAEMMTEVEAARQLGYYAVDMVNDGLDGTKQISMAKLFAGDLMQKVMYQCQQAFGGFGYTTEYPIGRAWTDARLITIGGGTSEIMKEIIAKFAGVVTG